jgi:hypothetical protein
LDDSDSSVDGGYNSGGNDSDDAELDELLLTGNSQLSLCSSRQLPSQVKHTHTSSASCMLLEYRFARVSLAC